MKIGWNQKQPGFTLVELLIAIVVIAILAAISVVAYNNIQDRAYNARITSAMDAYGKAFHLYHVDEGVFPTLADGAACLGTVQDYPAKDGFPEGACSTWTTSGGNVDYYYVDDDLSDKLVKYLGSNMPDPTIRIATEKFPGGGSTKYRGIYLETGNYESYQDYAYLEYVANGQVTCLADYSTRYEAEQNVTFCSMMIRAG